MEAEPKLRLLIVEDEFLIALDTEAQIEALGHQAVATAGTATEAIAFAGEHAPDFVLMDIRLRGSRDGIDAAVEIQKRFGIRSIFVTANADPATRRRAEAIDPAGFIEKPLSKETLFRALRAAKV